MFLVKTKIIENLGQATCSCTLPNGELLVGTAEHVVKMITPSGLLTLFAGYPNDRGYVNRVGVESRFDNIRDLIVSEGGFLVVDCENHCIRLLEVNSNTMTFVGRIPSQRLRIPKRVLKLSIDTLLISDEHRIVIMETLGGIRTIVTLAGGVEGFNDGQGGEARFSFPGGLALLSWGGVLVADTGNHSIRLVTMDGRVTTMGGNGEEGGGDGAANEARFSYPQSVCVYNGRIIVADTGNNRLVELQGGRVITVAGSVFGYGGSTDGMGAFAMFQNPTHVSDDGNGSLLVVELQQENQLRIVSDVEVLSV
jgi:hypothetical protein